MAAGRGLVAAVLAAAAFATPAQAGTLTTLVSSSALDLSGYDPGAGLSVELVRNGIVIGRAAATATDGTLHVGAGGTCWSTFTPQIRAGDTVRVSGSGVPDSPVVVPDLSVQAPGGSTQASGTAPDGSQVTVALLDAGGAAVETQSVTAAAGAWTATFTSTVAAGARATLVDAQGNTTVVDTSATPAACPSAPFSDTAVTAVDPGHVVAGAPTINAAGAGQALMISGAGSGPLTVSLGGAQQTITGDGTWTATFAESALAGLQDDTYKIGVTGGIGMSIKKDTVAPGPPTSNPPPGRYLAAPLVTLAPPEPGASVHYTLDGSSPGFNSPVFGLALRVTGAQTIRAFAVDAAGNPGPMVSLAYQLAPADGGPPVIPGVPPPDRTGTPPAGGTPPLPRIGAITLLKRISLPRLQARGLTASVVLGEGTTAVRFTVYRRIIRRGHRRLKLVASIVRVPGHAGRYRVRLNARALGLTREGLYRLKIVPGLSRATLDQAATRTVWLRVVR